VPNAVGLVVIRPDGIQERLDGRGALPLFERDTLRTGPGGRALVDFRDGTRLALNKDTAIRLLSRWAKAHGGTRILRLETGEVWLKASRRTRMFAEVWPTEIETPVGTAASRDGEIGVAYGADGRAVLSTVQGTADLLTPFGTCAVGAAMRSVVMRGKRCSDPATVDAAASVAWTAPLLK